MRKEKHHCLNLTVEYSDILTEFLADLFPEIAFSNEKIFYFFDSTESVW